MLGWRVGGRGGAANSGSADSCVCFRFPFAGHYEFLNKASAFLNQASASLRAGNLRLSRLSTYLKKEKPTDEKIHEFANHLEHVESRIFKATEAHPRSAIRRDF